MMTSLFLGTAFAADLSMSGNMPLGASMGNGGALWFNAEGRLDRSMDPHSPYPEYDFISVSISLEVMDWLDIEIQRGQGATDQEINCWFTIESLPLPQNKEEFEMFVWKRINSNEYRLWCTPINMYQNNYFIINGKLEKEPSVKLK
ncbi:MAG: hypothetical protein WCI71_18970 [Bacteroidota bacterium]